MPKRPPVAGVAVVVPKSGGALDVVNVGFAPKDKNVSCAHMYYSKKLLPNSPRLAVVVVGTLNP